MLLKLFYLAKGILWFSFSGGSRSLIEVFFLKKTFTALLFYFNFFGRMGGGVRVNIFLYWWNFSIFVSILWSNINSCDNTRGIWRVNDYINLAGINKLTFLNFIQKTFVIFKVFLKARLKSSPFYSRKLLNERLEKDFKSFLFHILAHLKDLFNLWIG